MIGLQCDDMRTWEVTHDHFVIYTECIADVISALLTVVSVFTCIDSDFDLSPTVLGWNVQSCTSYIVVSNVFPEIGKEFY